MRTALTTDLFANPEEGDVSSSENSSKVNTPAGGKSATVFAFLEEESKSVNDIKTSPPQGKVYLHVNTAGSSTNTNGTLDSMQY